MRKFLSSAMAIGLIVERIHQLAKTHSPQYKKAMEDSVARIRKKLRLHRTALDEIYEFLGTKELPSKAFHEIFLRNHVHTWPCLGEYLAAILTLHKEIGIPHGKFASKLEGKCTIDVIYEFEDIADFDLIDCKLHQDATLRIRNVMKHPAFLNEDQKIIWPRGFLFASFKNTRIVLTELHVDGEHVLFVICNPENSDEIAEFAKQIKHQQRYHGPYTGWVVEAFVPTDKKTVQVYFDEELSETLRHKPAAPNRATYSEAVRFLVEKDIPSFIEKSAFFKEQKKDHRRSYLLAGPPGTGKSHIIRDIISQMPSNWTTLVARESNTIERLADIASMSWIQPMLLIIEDIDLLVERGSATEQRLLEFLDGMDAPEELITIMTTNNPQKLSPALINRPGRVDKILLVGPGNEKERAAQLEILLEGTQSPFSSHEIAKRTGGFTFAQYREIVRRAIIYSDSPTNLDKIEIAINECVAENQVRIELLTLLPET